MKKPTYSISLLMMTIIFAWLTLAVTGTANAKWLCIHGHSGQIEDESALKKISRLRSGLDCEFKPGVKHTWVHFPVPSLKRYGSIRFIRLKYYTHETEVTELEVYNGTKREVQMKEVPWYWKTKGWHDVKVNLDDPISSQNGICISVKVQSGIYYEPTKQRFKFCSAQVDFDASGLITWYVDDDSGKPYPGKGTKWNPFHEIQMAIDAAWPGETVMVAAGTYHESITLKDGVNVSGEGANVTFISGGYSADPGVTVKNAEYVELDGFTIMNCYHGGMFVEDSWAVVEDCTFKNNNGGVKTLGNNNKGNYVGGGIYSYDSMLTVANCVFSNNTSGSYGWGVGGAIYNDDSSATIENCTFEDNSADTGGGIYNDNSGATIENCTFRDNSAVYGGGIYNSNSSLTATACNFSNNSVEHGVYYATAGAIYNYVSALYATDCTFDNNSATSNSGAIENRKSFMVLRKCDFKNNKADSSRGGISISDTSAVLTNCQFHWNGADYGGALYITNNNGELVEINQCVFWSNQAVSDAAIYNSSSSSGSPALTVTNCTFYDNFCFNGAHSIDNVGNVATTVTNCILWHRGSTQPAISGAATVTYSDVMGGYSGTGNMNQDPRFVMPDDGCFRLQANSPCIDAGTNNATLLETDFYGDPRIRNGDNWGGATVDMGVHEF